jgi:hypothetical protein
LSEDLSSCKLSIDFSNDIDQRLFVQLFENITSIFKGFIVDLSRFPSFLIVSLTEYFEMRQFTSLINDQISVPSYL